MLQTVKIRIAKGFEKRIAKGKMAQEDADKILAKITTGVKDICSDCDLIVEAAMENMEIKKTDLQRAGRDLQAGVYLRYQHLFPVHHRDRRRHWTAMWWECISSIRLR